MATIDERVVSMKFDSRGFGDGVRGVMNMLDKLKAALKLDGATRGLQEVDAAAKRVSFDSVAAGVENISSKFTALGIVGITTLTNLTNKAVDAGSRIVKSLTVDPITTGLQEYETQMGAIQTILANTQSKGSTLEDVNGALGELNEYSDKTIYNFTEMARNIGTFTAAGLDLDTSTSSIKGIANLAALSGSTSEQASTAMYQLSQAMAAGKISLMDWNSVVNAGMGGQVLQDALKQTAEAMGTDVDAIIKSKGSFRESLQEGWITSDVMSKTLQTFTGDMTEAELASMGFSEAQVQNIQKMATTASDAATKVKTMSQLMDTLKEGVQSGWAQTWQIVFGDFEEAKASFSAASDGISKFLGQFADARNDLLSGWKELGGRTDLLEGLSNIWKTFIAIFNGVRIAADEVLPEFTAEKLKAITQAFADFTAQLFPSDETVEKFARALGGVFAILDIGRMVIFEALGMFADLFGVIASGSGGFLDVAANVGDALVAFRDFVAEGNFVSNFFSMLGGFIKTPLVILGTFASAVRDVFNGADFGTALIDRFSQLGGLIQEVLSILFKGDFTGAGPFEEDSPIVAGLFRVREGFEALAGMARQAFDILFKGDFTGGPFEEDSPIVSGLFAFRDAFLDFFNTGNFNAVLDLFNTGFLAGLVLLVKKFVDGFGEATNFDGIRESITGVLDGVTGSLTAMQTNIKADTMVTIAAAIGIMTLSIIGLSMIDSGKLTSALTAITVMFTQLTAVMVALDVFISLGAAVKLPIIAGALTGLAIAVGILAISVKSLSELSWSELAIGLTGVAGALLALSVSAQIISGNTSGLITAGIGLTALAVAVNILASAVQKFAEMNWQGMVQGLVGVAGTLVALSIFAKVGAANQAGLLQSAGLVLLASAISILAGVVQTFGSMPTATIAQGMISMAGALVILSAAMAMMPANLPVTAMGLIAVSGALVILAGALGMMAGMTWDEIARGLTALAGSLVIIAGALMLMTGALSGAAAIVVISAALTLLIPPLIALSLMSFGQIATGLGVLAAAFGVIGVAGLILGPLSPVLLAIGVAIGLLGVATMAAGAGVSLFAAGLTSLAAAGAAGAVGLTAFITGVLNVLPLVITALGTVIASLAEVITNGGPAIVSAIVAVLGSLMEAVITLTPQIGALIQSLVNLLIQIMSENIPALANSGLEMLTAILQAIANNMGDVVDTAWEVAENFLSGVEDKMPAISQKGADVIITFVESLSSTIRNNSQRMKNAGWELAVAIADGITGGLASKAGAIANKAREVGQGVTSALKSALRINSPSKETYEIGEFAGQGIVNALGVYGKKTYGAAYSVGTNAVDGLSEALKKVQTPLEDDLDFSPHIRPVLDLSNVTEGARRIGAMIGKDISIDTSIRRANNSYTPAEEGHANPAANPPGGTTYIQNIHSPRELSPSEVYRQTKSLLTIK